MLVIGAYLLNFYPAGGTRPLADSGALRALVEVLWRSELLIERSNRILKDLGPIGSARGLVSEVADHEANDLLDGDPSGWEVSLRKREGFVGAGVDDLTG
jgi:hypothetical protein